MRSRDFNPANGAELREEQLQGNETPVGNPGLSESTDRTLCAVITDYTRHGSHLPSSHMASTVSLYYRLR